MRKNRSLQGSHLSNHKSDEKFQTLTEISTDSVLYLEPGEDEIFRITYANPAFYLESGLTPENVIGVTFLEVMPESEKQSGFFEFSEALREKKVVEWKMGVKLPHTEKFGLVKVVPVLDNEKKVTAVAIVIKNITSAKKAEKSLSEIKDRWQFATEGAGDGVWDWNPQTGKVFYSKQWKEMLGFQEDEIMDDLNEWEKRVHPGDKEKVYASLNDYLEGKTSSYEHEYRILCKDGTYIWILDRGKIFQRNEKGKPLRVIGTHKNISERIKNQQQIKELSNIVQNSLNEIYIFDFETLKFFYANQSALSNLGFSKEEIINLTPLNIKPNISTDAFLQQLELLRKNVKKIVDFETIHRRKDGSTYPVEVNLQRTNFEGENAFLAIIQDITDKKQIENKIRKSERILQLFIENSPASIAMFDNQMKYIFASKRYQTDYDLEGQNIIGRSHYDIFPEIPDRWKEIHKRCLAGETIKADEDPFLRVNGKLDWVHWEIRPWYISSKEIGGIILFSEVITNQKQTLEKLRESEEYNRMLYDESSIGLAVAKMDGQLDDINLAFANIIGRTIDETKNLTYWDITPLRYEKQEQEQLKSLRETGKYGPYEKEYIHKNGNLVPVRLQGKIIERNGEQFILSSVEDISQRILAEKALFESEEKFRKAFYTSPDSINITRVSDGKYLEINKGFENVIGYKPEEIVGKTSLELNIWKNPEDRNKLINGLNKFGTVNNLEAEFLAKNGTVIYGLMSANYIELHNEKVILSITRDITEIKESELKIRESEAYFRTIFEQSASGMILVSLDEVLINVNTRYCEMLNYTSSELIGKSLMEFTVPEDRNIGRDEIKKMLAGKINKSKFIKRYFKKTGEIIWVQVNSALLSDDQKKPKYFISQIEDITKQIETDNLIRSSENKYKALVEQSLTGIYIFEKDKFIYVNNRFCEIFGYPEQEIMSGMKPTDVVTTDERDRAEQNINKRLTGEIESVRYTARGNHKTGRQLWVEIHGTHIELDNKQVIMGTVLDITERKRAENELVKTNAFIENILKQSPHSTWISDKNGTLIQINHACCNLLNVKEEEVVGKYNILNDQGLIDQGLLPQIKEVYNKGIPARFEIRYETSKIGSLKLSGYKSIYLDASIYPVKDAEGNVTNGIIQHVDITEQKRAEEEIKKLNGELEQKVEERTRELEAKITEIQRMNNLFIGRELRMMELKSKIKVLEELLSNKKNN